MKWNVTFAPGWGRGVARRKGKERTEDKRRRRIADCSEKERREEGREERKRGEDERMIEVQYR